MTPDPKLKGVKDGNCNRTACQAPNAIWWNTGTRAYYCHHCAITIQRSENDFAGMNGKPLEIFPDIFNPDDPRNKRPTR